MPLFGAHMTIAGGFHNALLAAREHDCEAVQLFTAQPRMWPVTAAPAPRTAVRSGRVLTKNSNPWKGKDLADQDVVRFQETLRRTRVRQLLGHDSYLINLASPDETLYRRSLEAFVIEVQRAERL